MTNAYTRNAMLIMSISTMELMMKLSRGLLTGILLTASPRWFLPPLTPANASRVILSSASSITAMPEAFTLSIVPNDQALRHPDSQVVGHCANDTHKILLHPDQQW